LPGKIPGPKLSDIAEFMAAGEALTKKKLFDLKELRDEAKAVMEKKSSLLGRFAALWSFTFLATASAYIMIMAACYLWLVESMLPQIALLATALISVTLALIATAIWKNHNS